jgi:hypothetical protein
MTLKELLDEQETKFKKEFYTRIIVNDEKDHDKGVFLQGIMDNWLKQSYIPHIADFLRQSNIEIVKWVMEMIEGKRKQHNEFECSGTGGHYESFCTDNNCSKAPKEYNSAIDDIKSALNKSIE